MDNLQKIHMKATVMLWHVISSRDLDFLDMVNTE